MRVDEQGWLVAEDGDPPLVVLPSVRATKLGMKKPKALIWHWSGTITETALQATERIQTYTPEKDSPKSWHVLIGKDGTVYQSVSLHMAAWHTHRSGILGVNYYQNINKATLGLILENAGRLRRVNDQWHTQPPWRKKKPVKDVLSPTIDASRVTMHGTIGYDTYTGQQEASAESVLRAIVNYYGILRKYCTVSHSSLDYPRHEDPGPLWMDVVLPRVLGRVFP
jgi:N-acetyl-anhydromuramyl-L-alanine amidase AmpD